MLVSGSSARGAWGFHASCVIDPAQPQAPLQPQSINQSYSIFGLCFIGLPRVSMWACDHVPWMISIVTRTRVEAGTKELALSTLRSVGKGTEGGHLLFRSGWFHGHR